MKTSVIGYPRIGGKRELKFITEDYFSGKIPSETLFFKAAGLRKAQWLLQKQSGVFYIPSNDFSFYDGVLDTACLIGAIPASYRALGLHAPGTYFAMARGYQGPQGDVKALSMRKWFNTNYHFMVPVLEDDMELKLSGPKPFEEYAEAKALGIKTKPVLTGPFTFLKLAELAGKKTAQDYVIDITRVYADVLRKFNTLGCEWLQLDEPSLVCDLSKEDIALFTSIYSALLGEKGALNILLQTYFGDIRDIYSEAAALGFDGIGLDFVEGAKTAALIQTGFPKDSLLFAGVVNGKNIWRNDYKKTLSLLQEASKAIDPERIVIGTSCSLLHVPYTLSNEEGMGDPYRRHFAFAEEKLAELAELKTLSVDTDYAQNPLFTQNAALTGFKKADKDKTLLQKITAFDKKDFTRLPAFEEREVLQRKALNLPLLPATTIGSFPQTADVKAARASYKKAQLRKEEYEAFIREKIAACIALQEALGLDVLVHGEYERNDMVEYFGENLDGFVFTQKAWVQSYGTRCVKPPIIFGDIRRKAPITVELSAYAQSLTRKPVKGMLTGPVTILNWSFPREDIKKNEMAFQLALALRDEVADLEAAGIRVIQIDEAALKEKIPLRHSERHSEYLDWAIPAFRLVHAAARPETQIHTHMCYSEFSDILKEIDAMDADVISFEAARSGHAIVDTLVQARFKTQAGPGVYDIHSPRVPGRQELEDIITETAKKLNPQKLWVNPDCGLKTRGEAETTASLKNMTAAARAVRSKLS
jgi:5-methyltetrahydropteroyltriglutamate--homocysteine methyltransferase